MEYIFTIELLLTGERSRSPRKKVSSANHDARLVLTFYTLDDGEFLQEGLSCIEKSFRCCRTLCGSTRFGRERRRAFSIGSSLPHFSVRFVGSPSREDEFKLISWVESVSEAI